jgi:hypothetical protein
VRNFQIRWQKRKGKRKKRENEKEIKKRNEERNEETKKDEGENSLMEGFSSIFLLPLKNLLSFFGSYVSGEIRRLFSTHEREEKIRAKVKLMISNGRCIEFKCIIKIIHYFP